METYVTAKQSISLSVVLGFCGLRFMAYRRKQRGQVLLAAWSKSQTRNTATAFGRSFSWFQF